VGGRREIYKEWVEVRGGGWVCSPRWFTGGSGVGMMEGECDERQRGGRGGVSEVEVIKGRGREGEVK